MTDLDRKAATLMAWRECQNDPPENWEEDTWHRPGDPAECTEDCWVLTVPLLHPTSDPADTRELVRYVNYAEVAQTRACVAALESMASKEDQDGTD